MKELRQLRRKYKKDKTVTRFLDAIINGLTDLRRSTAPRQHNFRGGRRPLTSPRTQKVASK